METAASNAHTFSAISPAKPGESPARGSHEIAVLAHRRKAILDHPPKTVCNSPMNVKTLTCLFLILMRTLSAEAGALAESEPRTLEVVGEGSVEVTPNIATVSIGGGILRHTGGQGPRGEP